jgi:hypothetical protein
MHPKLAEIEERLRRALDELDNYLEDTYGTVYQLHPNRLDRGEASSPSYDGLFSVHAKFSLGYGSETGRGYILHISLSTLEQIPKPKRSKIEQDAVEKMNAIIPRYFPERDIRVTRDGGVYKIVGDFSLGDA